MGFTYVSSNTQAEYFYRKNLQGDVIGIVNATGASVAEYRYDAWGEVLEATGVLADVNAIRYRGYYYDAETGLHYVSSRYYDPGICRWINSDVYASTGQGILGCNMFAYCGNAPVDGYDPRGTKPWYLDLKCNPQEDNTIRYSVPLYKQGNTNLCWATCQWMMFSYRNGINYPEEMAKALIIMTAINEAFPNVYSWDSPGWPNNLGEKVEINSIEELYEVLLNKGPVYAYYRAPKPKDPNAPRPAHLVIIIGVDLNRDTVYTNNPHGVSGGQRYSSFRSGYLTTSGIPIDRPFEWIYLVEGD